MDNQKQRVYDALNKMNIKYEVVEHEPVHTMEDMDRFGLPAKGTLCKNLFLKRKTSFPCNRRREFKGRFKILGSSAWCKRS